MNLIKRLIPPRIRRLWIIELKMLLVAVITVLLIWACLIIMNNTIRTPPEPLKYKVLEFSACSGWTSTGVAEKQQVFQSQERVLACGRLRTNHPVVLSVYWVYEGQDIYRDVISDVEDQFLSEFTPTEKGLPPGNYELDLVIGKKSEGQAEFKVVPP